MINLKTPEQIIKYRETGKIAANVLEDLIDFVKEGVSTYEIAIKAQDLIENKYNAVASCIGQYDFEFALCSSINDVVCHGIPSKHEILANGDILNLDVTVKKHGLVSDTSRMYLIGDVSQGAKRLSRVTQECLYKGINEVKPGKTLGDIGFVIQKHAKKNGYSVVREYAGHGIGENMHELPEVLHYGKRNKGVKLVEGMTFTIEPMINEGTRKVEHLEDDWTVVTADGKLSAQWEHTILVTSNGFEVLTLRDEEILSDIKNS